MPRGPTLEARTTRARSSRDDHQALLTHPLGRPWPRLPALRLPPRPPPPARHPLPPPHRADPHHGTWAFAVDTPPVDGHHRTVRRAGFPDEPRAHIALRRFNEGLARVVDTLEDRAGSRSFGEITPADGYVFHRHGRPLHPKSVLDRFHLLCDKAGVPRIALHDLRHLAASFTLAAGVPLPVVSKTLRHRALSTTANIAPAPSPATACLPAHPNSRASDVLADVAR
ncbi:tyrosine-type recombinase/integrase [Kitasatospora sp. NPDC057965]|uniref:tyrosine-type recombinase/integrase n=1 Tax=Kitasatospora sp. NPDC057965 TaxID=3346291 RepID=UPI0036D867E2